ncbi:alpha-mannosidase, partial [Verrucomicrobiota bacterium]
MASDRVTVHMIGNAHLDPVWLWRWPTGIGEAVATCRSAADRMDEYPDFVFTRSDVWVYEQIERLAPELFERIRRRVAEGRWAIVGGWIVQSDCNLPTAESFRRHMSIGRRYFLDRFGVDVTVGYNVDSFGHCATLPSLLREAGYDAYVMMRPQQHEKELPSPLFRWKAPDGSEVLTWRIVEGYADHHEDLKDHIQAAVDAALPGIDHVMCFYGVGDHGGGPTKQQIEWIRNNREAVSGAVLQFSHPRAFFDAVKEQAHSLPVVEDELQMHAIGCYSVVRDIKTAVSRAENGLIAAESAVKAFPCEAPEDAGARLEEAWKRTLFH